VEYSLGTMQHPATARRQAQPSGVIETLSAGYAALNRQLWVLALPILLDVFLWLGPQVSYSPLVDPAVTRATEWTRQVTVGPRRGPRAFEVTSQLESARVWLIAEAGEVNGLTLLAWSPLAPPTVGSSLPNTSRGLAFIGSWPQGLGLGAACVVLSLVLGGWFYRGLAAASSGVSGGPLRAGRGALLAATRVIGLVAALVGAAALVGLPLLLLVAFTALVSPPVAVLGGVLILAALVFAVVHLFFAVDAIVVSNVGPLLAIQRSVGVVRRHLWPSVALIVLTWLILAGMQRVWDALASNLQAPYGIALGILGNAYIASGLIAAGMIFYLQRAPSESGAHTSGISSTSTSTPT
jgi:hypothetical protein